MNETTGDRLAADLEILIELFQSNGWRELRVESEGVSLLLSQDRSSPSLGGAYSAPQPAIQTAATTVVADVVVTRDEPRQAGAIDPAWAMVQAPNLGTFYRSPKPGSAPFVDVGQKVQPNTEVCLIEVMKLFTSVQAGVAGTVRHIAVADAELVEGGQALIYIERD